MNNINNIKINLNIKNWTMIMAAVFLFFSFTFTHSQFAHAETDVSLDSTVRSTEVGNDVVVDLRVSASVNPINVVDGTIVYDQNKLAVKSISFDDSIISLWVKKPVVIDGVVGGVIDGVADSVAGQINLTGGIPNGYVGKNGEILRIIFKAKDVGTTTVDFKDSFAVFQNDGKGTKINPWMKPLSFSILPFPGPDLSTILLAALTFISLVLALGVLIFILKKYAKHY